MFEPNIPDTNNELDNNVLDDVSLQSSDVSDTSSESSIELSSHTNPMKLYSYNKDKQTYYNYDEYLNIMDELNVFEYDSNKNLNHWKYAKTIILDYAKDSMCTEYLWDYIEKDFIKNNDTFNNITRILFTSDVDIYSDISDTDNKIIIKNDSSTDNVSEFGISYNTKINSNKVYEFNTGVAKFVIENLKIYKYQPRGYVFNTYINTNIFSFKIVIITNKSIYSINRYIDEYTIA